ncbi:MAG: hypothetical protein ACK4K7_01365 [Allosphingosinicella sp.]|uniref:hypothetical protein n=1 Tax=Allosphingosinicella sp. TaxID=2823234 RepID=UPI0039511275
MRMFGPSLAVTLLLAACRGGGGAADNGAAPPPPEPAGSPAPPVASAGTAAWDLVASGEGTALRLGGSGGGRAALALFCPAGGAELVVNVPGFRPVGSEERMTFGSGGEVTTLVADTAGDALRGGVSGAGPVPANLAALIAGPIGVNYGAQNSGPHDAPPADLARGFAAACADRAAAAPAPGPSPAATAGSGASACRVQDGARLDVPPVRAIGTEPFWNARVDGRCVTYSHPDDQAGTRVWTRYRAEEGGGGVWSGALGGRLFELRLRPRPGCSDGMSDRRYPMEAELMVNGERRRGCAEPA